MESKAPKFEIEATYTVWNNQDGERIEVGSDRDGLELNEIRYYGDVKKDEPESSIILNDEQLRLLHYAIGKLLKEKQELLDISQPM